MKVTEAILVISSALCLLVADRGIVQASSGSDPNTVQRKPSDPNMSKFGPKLSKEELARIAKLTTPELVDMLKTGDTRHAYAARNRLKAGQGWIANFDLLLSIAAETRGNMIVEGFMGPVKPSASAEDKARVDKFLDFLESQLKKDKPSVSRRQTIRSIAKTVFISAALEPAWRPETNGPVDPNNLQVPYGNARVLSILTRCLDSKDWQVRSEAVLWLGSVGANDLAKAEQVAALLNAQFGKEETSEEKESVKATMKQNIQTALGALNRQIKYLRYGMPTMEELYSTPF